MRRTEEEEAAAGGAEAIMLHLIGDIPDVVGNETRKHDSQLKGIQVSGDSFSQVSVQ